MPRMLDSNVLLDIVTADAAWLKWSTGQFREAASESPILVNPIIYAELAPAFSAQAALDRWFRFRIHRSFGIAGIKMSNI